MHLGDATVGVCKQGSCKLLPIVFNCLAVCREAACLSVDTNRLSVVGPMNLAGLLHPFPPKSYTDVQS